ncbi:L-threonylcarbamoyladenylate synthase [Coraliomargarita akajimensis]|uniref:Threonylcarbamoyl-AMP synthase n=1 Tax=Coraliomargarita akajimensis (strain DSM 45221 / IAM 15411 / JCM 23193 / KCTC 12865 / 04OKA010-24) TaxID=583355 RepID=D5ENH8_CORAD|nr:L-threonylcarbamoyladenylate synthase [Coraliomargarita akajimensis]ADE55454.1 Sua5/YciO/YrdC/YwlC family protein [Coraliomargarita akajimensis DSM 45221]
MRTNTICLEPTEQNIQHCAELLSAGELVAVPTETVYGLAGNALDEDSARKIFEVKGRPFIDPLISHFHSIEAATSHIEWSDSIQRAAKAFWPGALTIVANKQSTIPDIVTAGLPSAAIRVPGHPVFRKLLSKIDFPLAAPSANPFGYVSPTKAEHVERTLGTRLRAILDAGPCLHGVESTILDLRNESAPRILRQGPISSESISDAIGRTVSETTNASRDDSSQAAPGLLSQHYSPHTPVSLYAPNSLSAEQFPADCAVVFNCKPTAAHLHSNTFWFSQNGDTCEVAHNLFDLIQRLDQQNFSHLHIETCPDIGIGKAVNDRLKRAAAKRSQ